MSVSVPSIAGSFRIGPIASTTLPAIRVSQPFSRAFLCPATHKRSATTPSREATDPRRHSFSRWYLYSYRHWRKYVNPSTNSVGSRVAGDADSDSALEARRRGGGVADVVGIRCGAISG